VRAAVIDAEMLFSLFRYDIDSNSRNLKDHDFLGSLECSLGEIVSAQKLHKPLNGPKSNSGTITGSTIFFPFLLGGDFSFRRRIAKLQG
jgi:hypothetical protein